MIVFEHTHTHTQILDKSPWLTPDNPEWPGLLHGKVQNQVQPHSGKPKGNGKHAGTMRSALNCLLAFTMLSNHLAVLACWMCAYHFSPWYDLRFSLYETRLHGQGQQER